MADPAVTAAPTLPTATVAGTPPATLPNPTNAPVVPETFTPDPAKSEAENATAKTAWEVAKAAAAPPQTPEQKATAEQKAKDEAAAAAAAKADDTKLTPFKLEEIKLPEGFEANKPLQEKFVALVNETGLPRSVANRLITLQAEATKAASEASSKAVEKMREGWEAEAKADKEIGGDKLQPALSSISKLVDHYGGKEVREMMDLTGAGNHPAMVRFLAKIATDLGEARFVSGGAPDTSKSTADKIFDKTAKT